MSSGYSQQSIIHSKHARVEKKKGDVTLGRLIKGNLAFESTKISRGRSQTHSKQIIQEIEYLPKTKANIARRMNRTSLHPNPQQIEHIVFMESAVFPSIYFKKTTLRHVLKEFVFPADVKALPPSDGRTPLIYQIVSNLFNEINFYIFNILVGENPITNSLYIFFSDSETIPYSKCCNSPVFIELTENGSGKVLCNSEKCQTPNLAEFLINFEDGRKLWKNLRYFADASEKDKDLRNKISRLINNGKFKKINLIDVVQSTSKEIVEIFYHSKRHNKPPQESIEEDEGPSPFLTGHNYNTSRPAHFSASLPEQVPPQPQPTPNGEFSDLQLNSLPANNTFMSSTYYDYQSKLSQGLVNEGKVFHKDFNLIKKIDAYLLDRKRTRNTTRLNFPRIMSEFQREKKSMSHTQDNISSELKNMIGNPIL